MSHAKTDDFLEALADANKSNGTLRFMQVWDLTTAFFAQNGFDKLIYLDARPDRLVMLTTLPTEWVSRYQDCNYEQIDPFFAHCGTTFRPVSTGIAYAEKHDGLSRAQVSMISEAAEFGINAGFSSTIRLSGPKGMTGWNIGSSQTRKEVDKLRAGREPDLRLAARFAHDALAAAQCAGSLSRREAQCLVLLTQGQRTKDIARNLNLSSAAVELYLRNARRKLGAATREQAVAIVTERGLHSF